MDYVVDLIAKVRYEFRCGYTATQLSEKMSRIWRQHLLGDAQPLRSEWIPTVEVVEVLRVVQIDLEYVAGVRVDLDRRDVQSVDLVSVEPSEVRQR